MSLKGSDHISSIDRKHHPQDEIGLCLLADGKDHLLHKAASVIYQHAWKYLSLNVRGSWGELSYAVVASPPMPFFLLTLAEGDG